MLNFQSKKTILVNGAFKLTNEKDVTSQLATYSAVNMVRGE